MVQAPSPAPVVTPVAAKAPTQGAAKSSDVVQSPSVVGVSTTPEPVAAPPAAVPEPAAPLEGEKPVEQVSPAPIGAPLDEAPLVSGTPFTEDRAWPPAAEAAGAAVSVRPATAPSFPTTAGYAQVRASEGLPAILAGRVRGLPEAYMELARSYRNAKATRTGSRAKRNMRLHREVADAITRQLVQDKRLLSIRDLKPSHYVDAALTMARGYQVEMLITEADKFREYHLGEGSGSEAPNHYTISQKNFDWLEEMTDELLLANATGLHGYMINVVIQAYLQQLAAQEPGSPSSG
ncbi:hypothetical protein ACFVW1_23710 [Streptomyces olivochromogenes]|uniref:hypothetical protein n=1 Tax=Streptomyces olivochromogenes TaxID=1963 RepID=UPI0036D98A0C